MQTIVPNLWFDDQAEAAADYYTATFEPSSIGPVTRYGGAGQEVHGKAAGSVLTVEFELAGHRFVGLHGGPQFTFTPAISFFLSCETANEVDELFDELAEGGDVLMPLQRYPFSDRYAWVEDRFGVSWQLYLGDGGTQKIAPCLMFVGDQAGNAEEAIEFYTAVFPDSGIDGITRYGPDDAPDVEGTVEHATFRLCGQELQAKDSNRDHPFTFNEAVSLAIDCETQDEIDRYWDALSADPAAEQCGWLKDRYGVSWQVVPTVLGEMLRDEAGGRAERVMDTVLQMKKLDVDELTKAYGTG